MFFNSVGKLSGVALTPVLVSKKDYFVSSTTTLQSLKNLRRWQKNVTSVSEIAVRMHSGPPAREPTRTDRESRGRRTGFASGKQQVALHSSVGVPFPFVLSVFRRALELAHRYFATSRPRYQRSVFMLSEIPCSSQRSTASMFQNTKKSVYTARRLTLVKAAIRLAFVLSCRFLSVLSISARFQGE